MVRVGSLTSGFDHDLHYLISDRVLCTLHRATNYSKLGVRDVALEIAFKKSAGALGADFLGHIRNRL